MATPAPLYPPPYAARPPRTANPWLIRLPVLVISGSVLLFLVLGLFLLAFQLRYQERIYPGVYIMDVNIGGLTLAEARAQIVQRFRYDQQAVFTFRDGDQRWQASAAELGVSFDADATLAAAFAVGHDADALTNLFYQAAAWFGGYSLSPIFRYDQNQAVARLTQIADAIYQEPANATLTLDGTTVTTTPGRHGRRLDITGTLAALDAVIMGMANGGEIPLVIHETPPLIWEADLAAEKIRAALSGAITLVATDENGAQLGPWLIAPEQIAALLQIAPVDNGDGTWRYDVSVDMSAFSSVLETLAPGLITPAQNARFHFDEASGQLVVIKPGISGRTLNVPQTLSRMESAVFTRENRIVPMAFDFNLPRYHNQITAAELGITQPITEATTYFTGSSAERRTNIAVAASKFDGLIIAPGEEFSFNTLLGDISYENGFVDAKVIVAEATTDGIGGGVCQVSTTAFRAAYQAGFFINELHSHSYRVGYYEINSPVGFDASIWQPDADFRFTNDTPYHLLIETEVFPASNAIQFRFYSTPYWQVTVETPQILSTTPPKATRYVANAAIPAGQALQVDYAAEGAEVIISRRVYDPNGNRKANDSPITRRYEPWGAVYEVAPNDSRLNQ